MPMMRAAAALARCLLLWLSCSIPGNQALRFEIDSLLDAIAHPSDTSLPAVEEFVSVAQRGSLSKDCKPYPGKRVVLVTVNTEYLDMFKNWLGSAAKFLQSTEHLHVVAEDGGVMGPLEQLRKDRQLEFTLSEQTHLSEQSNQSSPQAVSLLEGPFGSKDYGKVVWRRPWHILEFLQQGCTVLYTDIDTVWNKDPFHDIDAAGSGELFLTDDSNVPGWNYCTCFMYMQPTHATLSLMQDWGTHASSNMNQRVFNDRMKNALNTSAFVREKLQILPIGSFPPGKWAGDHPGASVYHANWISGIDSKVKFFQDRNLWKPSLLERGSA